METVRTQDVTFNDLAWKIKYTPDRCTMCGSCVAACTFNASKRELSGVQSLSQPDTNRNRTNAILQSR